MLNIFGDVIMNEKIITLKNLKVVIDEIKNKLGGSAESGDLIQSNPNLLDNPDFQINQRGKTTYYKQGVGMYSMDRWWVNNNALVSPNKNGIAISINPNSTDMCMQYLDSKLVEQIKNKTVTLSASFAGTVYSFSEVFSEENLIDNLKLKKTFDKYYGIGLGRDTKGYFAYFSFYNSGTTGARNVLVNWIKLELGDRATLFIPPNPNVELLKCQGYCQVFHGDLVREYDFFNGDIIFRVPMPTVMRGTIHAEVIGNGGQFSVLDINRKVQSGFTFNYNSYGFTPPTMKVTAKKAGHGLTSASLCVNSQDPFVLSTEP